MLDRSHDEAMIEIYRKDPAYAAYLLNDVLNDGDTDEIRHYLKMMNAAFGDGSGRPKSIDSLLATISAMGCRLSVTRLPAKPRRRGKTTKQKTPKRAVRARRPVSKIPVSS